MERQATGTRAAVVSAVSKIKHLRWYICALLFFATAINYIDRQALGAIAPELQKAIGWSETEYSRMVNAFQVAYAVMFLFWGRIIDRIGVRLGFAIAVVLWSLAGMSHALAATAIGFAAARFLLGIGEAANFPASIKAVAEWFPKRERSFATGVFNAGTNVGAIIAPAVAILLYEKVGWRSVFIFTGAVGFLWLAFWWAFYQRPEDHSRLSDDEFKQIRDGEEEPITEKVPMLPLLRFPQTWAFSLGKMLTDPVWWFYLFWLPKFLSSNYGIKGRDRIIYLTVVYIIADVGSVFGGWLASALTKRGWTLNRARKLSMFIFAFMMPLATVAYYSKNAWVAVILIGIAAGAHQGWSANLFTLTTDMFPRKAVGSVVGIGSCAGALGGVLMSTYVGTLLDKNPNYYLPMFIIAGVTYLVAWGAVQLLAPKLEPAKID